MAPERITKLTNCRLYLDNKLVRQDLYISSTTGKILDAQAAFFSSQTQPSETHDLGGRIVAPGFIEVQINGGWGFDFSVPSPRYAEDLAMFSREVVKTGVTSYAPTITSQKAAVYPQTVPHLARKSTRNASSGAESLGAHCEGPFINPLKNGIHKKEVLQAPTSLSALKSVYGASNLDIDPSTGRARITYITLAPELDPSETIIRALRARGIVVSVGHSTASFAQTTRAVSLGASMITHLYNAMPQPHHRDTGIVGVLGQRDTPGFTRPFFGLIADGVHVHPSMVRVAYEAHRRGCILVTDAMMLLGCADGEYEWTNGERIVKRGPVLTLKGAGKIAGSSATLVGCVNNLIRWAQVSVEEALGTVTATPARMLGLGEKGSLEVGKDADLVVLGEAEGEGGMELKVEQVWKFGEKVFEAESSAGQVRARL